MGVWALLHLYSSPVTVPDTVNEWERHKHGSAFYSWVERGVRNDRGVDETWLCGRLRPYAPSPSLLYLRKMTKVESTPPHLTFLPGQQSSDSCCSCNLCSEVVCQPLVASVMHSVLSLIVIFALLLLCQTFVLLVILHTWVMQSWQSKKTKSESYFFVIFLNSGFITFLHFKAHIHSSLSKLLCTMTVSRESAGKYPRARRDTHTSGSFSSSHLQYCGNNLDSPINLNMDFFGLWKRKALSPTNQELNLRPSWLTTVWLHLRAKRTCVL